MNGLERGGFARTRRSHQYDKPVVKLGSLSDSSYDSIGEWFRNQRFLPEPGSLVRLSSSQWSMATFRKRQ